jgi:hypothetical protein
MGSIVRRYAILEPILVFLLIMAYIWDLRFSYPGSCLAILGGMILSHCLRRERAPFLGFQAGNFRVCLEEWAPVVLLLGLLMLGAGILLGSTRHMRFDDGLLAWVAYVPWGIFQQYALNGYFLNRFHRTLSRRAAPMVVAALFSGVHLPNWFLMAVTLLAGYCSVQIYLRYKNLYFLGLIHGTIGFLLYLVVPDTISHHLAVGPGWFRH